MYELEIIADQLDEVLNGIEKQDVKLNGGQFDNQELELVLSNIAWYLEMILAKEFYLQN